MIKKVIILEHITLRVNRFLGTSHAFIIGLAVIAVWTFVDGDLKPRISGDYYRMCRLVFSAVQCQLLN